MQRLVSRGVLCVLFLLGAYAFVVIIRHWSLIDFDFKIPVMDVLTLGATIFLAWWVAGKLERGHTEDRFEKQLIKERLDDLSKDLKEFKKWIDGGGTFLAPLMESKLTEYRSIAASISSALSEGYQRISTDFQGKKSLPGRLTVLKQLCTFVPTTPQDEISLIEEEYTYNSDRMTAIDKLILQIREDIFQIQLRINRA